MKLAAIQDRVPDMTQFMPFCKNGGYSVATPWYLSNSVPANTSQYIFKMFPIKFYEKSPILVSVSFSIAERKKNFTKPAGGQHFLDWKLKLVKEKANFWSVRNLTWKGTFRLDNKVLHCGRDGRSVWKFIRSSFHVEFLREMVSFSYTDIWKQYPFHIPTEVVPL